MKTPAELSALIVDDNDYARAIAETSLRQWGVVDITEAADGVEALQVLAERQVDLVLLDWYMPEVNGAGFVRVARNSGYDPAILVTTAYPTRENVRRMQELELKNLLVKPFEPAQLHKAIIEAFSQSAGIQINIPAKRA